MIKKFNVHQNLPQYSQSQLTTQSIVRRGTGTTRKSKMLKKQNQCVQGCCSLDGGEARATRFAAKGNRDHAFRSTNDIRTRAQYSTASDETVSIGVSRSDGVIIDPVPFWTTAPAYLVLTETGSLMDVLIISVSTTSKFFFTSIVMCSLIEFINGELGLKSRDRSALFLSQKKKALPKNLPAARCNDASSSNFSPRAP